jgi:outer membrane immunogenic protein
MMNPKSLVASIVCVAAISGAAQSQDRPRTDLPPFIAGPSWTGFYLGGGLGAGAETRRVNANPGGATLNIDGLGGGGILASIHGGADYQVLPQAVIGVLAEGTWSNMTGSMSAQVTGANANVSSKSDLGLAILARAGVLATPSSLLYAVGGYAGQNFRTTGSAAAGGAMANFSRDDYFNGWTVGAGMETLLGGSWAAKLEYRYSQFEQKFISAANVSINPSMHTARLGLSYKFGGNGREVSAEEPVAPGRRDWTGFYGGVAGGAGIMANRLTAGVSGASATVDNTGQGLLGAVLIGADWQVDDRFLVGLMGDLTWPGMQSLLTAGGGGASATVATRTNMAASVLARVGFLASRSALLYAMGGYTNQSFTTTGYGGNGATLFSSEDRLSGFVLGPGIELMVAKGWSTRLEYRYSQFETRTLLNGVTMQPSSQTVRAGLTYKIGVN